MLVFVLEVLIGLLAYVYYEQIGQDLQRHLPTVFTETYAVDLERTEIINSLQQNVSITNFLVKIYNLYVDIFFSTCLVQMLWSRKL